ncbi:MAG: alpha-glycosidase [Clostridiales bacterium GWE2_32_10]|nr:MAG: alpha-glycosidase [Clostridiales bacterium GWE2_32_10]HBY20893.1 alpha-glycosidase [Clostridiales bacterium]
MDESVQVEVIFSDETDTYRTPSSPKTGDSIKVRIQTAKADFDNVYIHYDNKKIKMLIKCTSEFLDIYEVQIKNLKEDMEYYFCLVKNNKDFYFNKIGFNQNLDIQYNFKIKLDFQTPTWAKGAVMYQILVDRFFNGDPSNDVVDNEYMYLGKPVSKVKNWYEYPNAEDIREFYGGDLQGVIDKMDYLKDLGVDAIYFNPLFVSPSNHKYDVQDYDHIDPHLGIIKNDIYKPLSVDKLDNKYAKMYIKRTTDRENLKLSNELMRKLIEIAHERGIKVILDGVFNHCGSFNKWMDREEFYENAKNYPAGAYHDKNSRYNKNFKWFKDAWPENDSYDGWWGHKTLPKLNYEGSKRLQEYILNVGREWVSAPYNADGWRLDVAADLGYSKEFNHLFWRKFRKVVKEANPNAIIIAEHYGDPRDWLEGDQWDTVMNYDAFMEPISWFLTGMEKHSDDSNSGLFGNADSFESAMKYHMATMHAESLQVAMNELSNHDHSRFLTRTNRTIGRIYNKGPEAAAVGVNKGIFKEAIIIQMTWPGAPTIYYGDEAGVTGWTDPDNRRTYPWGREDLEILTFHKEAIKLHKKHEVIKTGSVKVIYKNYNMLAFARWNKEDMLISMFNNNDIEREMNIPVWVLGVKENEVFTRIMKTDISNYDTDEKKYRVENGGLYIKMAPYSSVVLVK